MVSGLALFRGSTPSADGEALTGGAPVEKFIPLNLVMQINHTQRSIVRLRPCLFIGRGSDHEGTPMIDLTRFGALERGVSRVHAELTYQDQTLFLKDLASTNGTRLNGLQIEPNTLYRLRNGDEIELGRLPIVLRLVRAPEPR
jgi:pSer/pThr/pTyr-binding forkhead associated (FHA) protein